LVRLQGAGHDDRTVIPEYIWHAIFFARERLSRELFFNIYRYRIARAAERGAIPAAVATTGGATLSQYRSGDIGLAAFKTAMTATLPGDQVHAMLALVTE
jgi:putative ATP-dependent endonuclease of the OLD family